MASKEIDGLSDAIDAIDDSSKVFWLLSLAMVLNFAVMYIIAQFSLDAYAVPASGMTEVIRSVLLMFTVAFFALAYGMASSRFCRYLCCELRWEGEAVFELVVLGIPGLIFYAVMIAYNSNTVVTAGGEVDCYLGGGLALSFSGRDALMVVTSALIIFFPVMLIVKPFIIMYIKKADVRKKRAAEYRNIASSLMLLGELASNDAVNSFQKKLGGIKDYRRGKVLHKRERRRFRSQIAIVLLLALSITLLHIFSYPQATQWLHEAQNSIYNMLLVPYGQK